MLARGSEPQFPVSHMIMRVSKQYTYNHSIPRQPLVLIFSAKCNGLSPGGSVVKNLPANAGDTGDVGSVPESGRSPGVGNGNPLQHSCVGNSTERGSWWAAVHGVRKSQYAINFMRYSTLYSKIDFVLDHFAQL